MRLGSSPSNGKLFAGLTVLASLVLVLGAAEAGLGIVRTYTSAELTTPVTVAPGVEQYVDLLATQPRGQTRADVRVDVVATDDTPVRTVVMVVDTFQAVAVGIDLLLAICVFSSSARRQAFTADNVRRMTSIGWIALAVAIGLVGIAAGAVVGDLGDEVVGRVRESHLAAGGVSVADHVLERFGDDSVERRLRRRRETEVVDRVDVHRQRSTRRQFLCSVGQRVDHRQMIQYRRAYPLDHPAYIVDERADLDAREGQHLRRALGSSVSTRRLAASTFMRTDVSRPRVDRSSE